MARRRTTIEKEPRAAIDERLMVMGMVVSDRILKSVRPIWKPELCATYAGRVVTEWCCDYWDNYAAAPRKNIEEIHEAALSTGRVSEDEAEGIAQLLDSCSQEYERTDSFNEDYVLDRTVIHIKSRALDKLADEVKIRVRNGDVQEAEAELSRFDKPELPSADAIDPWTDKGAIYNAFENTNKPLFTLPGAVGEMLNEHLIREGLIMLQGPMKRGKTWWLQELGFRASQARCNVAWFGVGDMSRDQMLIRHHVRLSGVSDRQKYCREGIIPVLDCELNQKNTCDHPWRVRSKGSVIEKDEESEEETKVPFVDAPIGYNPCCECMKRKSDRFRWRGAHWWEKRESCSPLTWREALKAGRKFKEKIARGRAYRLECYPNTTVDVGGLDSALDLFEAQGEVMDVVVVDYADILAPEPGYEHADRRIQIDETFKALRRLSQKRRVLLITASQADAPALELVSQKPRNFSESVRKYAHVTATVALNQTPSEKREGIMRTALLNVREGDFDVEQEVSVLQRLEEGCPLIASYWS